MYTSVVFDAKNSQCTRLCLSYLKYVNIFLVITFLLISFSFFFFIKKKHSSVRTNFHFIIQVGQTDKRYCWGAETAVILGV